MGQQVRQRVRLNPGDSVVVTERGPGLHYGTAVEYYTPSLYETEIYKRGRELFEIASRKGMLLVTDPEGSDRLVGFFVPAREMNKFSAALVDATPPALRRTPSNQIHFETPPLDCERADRALRAGGGASFQIGETDWKYLDRFGKEVA